MGDGPSIRYASPDDGPECPTCGYTRTDVALAHDGRTELLTEEGLPFQEPCADCGDPWRVVVAGSRSICHKDGGRALLRAFEATGWGSRATSVLHGTAKGPDRSGAAWGRWKGLPVVPYPARWEDVDADGAVVRTRDDGTQYNALAGHWRNERMAKDGHALVAIWDGESSGTRDIIERFEAKGKPVHTEVV